MILSVNESAKELATKLYNEVQSSDISRGRTMLADKADVNGYTQFALESITISYNGRKGWYYTSDVVHQPIDAIAETGIFNLGPTVLVNRVSLEEHEYATNKLVNVKFDVERLELSQDVLKEFLSRNRTIELGQGCLRMTTVNKAEFVDDDILFLNGDIDNVIDASAVRTLTFGSSVPSKERKGIATYVTKEVAPAYEQVLTDLCGGWVSQLVNVPTEIKAIVKKSAKVMLLCVGGFRSDFDLSKYGCLIYLGKFGGEEDRCDGAAKVSDAVIADKYNIGRKQARSLFLQMRNFRTSKVAAVCESSNQMELFEQIASEDLNKSILYVDKFEDIRDFDGQLIHVGNPNRVDFISDLNGFKNVPDITDPTNSFMVLDMGKDGQGSSNIQFLQYAQEMPGYVDTFAALGKRSLLKQLHNIRAKREYIAGLDINLDKVFAANIITQISPYVFRQGYIRTAVEKAIVQSMNKAIHTMHFKVDGTYLRGTASFENWTCKHQSQFLHEGEVFVNNASYWGHEVNVLRNPRSASPEYYHAAIPTLDTIVERILASDCSWKHKEYYIHAYASMSREILMTTGSADFKNKTGGSDFDFDGFMVSKDAAINKVIEYKPSFPVDIIASKASAGKVTCTSVLNVLEQGFIRTLTTGNKGVADIAIEDSKIQTILNLDDSEMKWRVYDHILAKLFGPDYKTLEVPDKEPYKRKYVGPCAIGEFEVLQNLEELKCGPKSIEVMDDFLQDVTIMFVAVIGRTIDSAKTGESVTDPMGDSLDNVHQLFRKKDPVTKKPFAFIDWNEGTKEFEARFRTKSFTTETSAGTQFYLKDKIYETQVEIVKWACKRIKFLRHVAMPDTETVLGHVAVSNGLICAKSLKEMDLASSDLAKINLVSNLDSKAVGKKATDFASPYIADFARYLLDLSGVAKEDRFSTALSVNDIYTGSSFAYNYLKEEAIHYAMTFPNAVTVVRERVLPLRDGMKGGIQDFSKGRSFGFVCTSYRFTGQFDVRFEPRFGWYFEVPVADIVKIPDVPAEPKIFFRAIINDKQPELMDAFKNRSKYRFFITSFHADRTTHDALWLQDENGNERYVCRINLGNELIMAAFHRTEVTLEDVIKESFKKGKNDTFREITSTTLLCRFEGGRVVESISSKEDSVEMQI